MRLGTKKDNISESIITIALTSNFIQLHTQKYNYKQWFSLLVGKEYNMGIPTAKFLKKLVNAWKFSLPIQGKLIFMPPEWTLKKWEVDCLDAFCDFVSALAADTHFRIIELTITSGWNRFAEILKEAYRHNQELHKSG